MARKRFKTVLIFGVPGVGKGTQGRVLGSIPGMFHCASGDIFRSLDPNSPEAEEVESYTSKGNLAPDDLTVRIWRQWLDAQIDSGRFNPGEELLLLDGIPRNVHQCEMLEEHVKVMRVIYLAASTDDPMVARIKQRALVEDRADDTDVEIIRRRFQVYREQSAPVLNYYPTELTTAINPMGSVAEVLHRILTCLIPVQNEFVISRGLFGQPENPRDPGTE